MKRWKVTLISALFAQIIALIGFAFFYPFLPFFIGKLGVANEGEQAFWAGLSLALNGLAMALCAPLWGTLSDRYGRKVLVCFSMFSGAFILFLLSYAQTVGQLLICRVLEGAFASTMGATTALVASISPVKKSGFTLGLTQSAMLVGMSAGPFLGGMASDALGYRMAFRSGAMLILMGALLACVGIKEDFSPIETTSNEGNKSGFRCFFSNKGFLMAVLILFGMTFSKNLVNPSFPLIIKEILPTLHNINSAAGNIMAAAAFAAAISAIILGALGDKIGHRKILIVGCVGGAVTSLGQYFAYSMSFLFVVRMLFGVFVGGLIP